MATAPAPRSRTSGTPAWRPLETPAVPASLAESAPIVVVGAGPVGLAMAIDLAQRGHRVVVIGKYPFVPAGSKAICFSKRSLDILDRLGIGEASVARGVTWNVGKVFWKDSREPIYQFDMLPVKNQKMPGFINLQQYHMEDLLLERAAQLPGIELRPGHEVTALTTREDGATVTIEHGGQAYSIDCRWLIACDGHRSFVRQSLGLDFDGRVFEDNFLIADIRMEDGRAPERWFWFDPPFNPDRSVLMHKQPDNVWRLDFQLGWGIDREAAVRPENVEPLVKAMLGEEIAFEEVWYSVYTFQCRRMSRFVHGPVIFAGDSAHLVSPFGARGCNGGFADIDNLGWKLDLVIRGEAPAALLESYNAEAIVTADANIQASSRTTDFLTPKSAASTVLRDAVLELAEDAPFGRQWVNSGRLSVAIPYPASTLNTPDSDDWAGRGIAPGMVCLDAPMGDRFLLEQLGDGFVLLCSEPGLACAGARTLTVPAEARLLRERYDLSGSAAYLIRPDQYVAARWKAATAGHVQSALGRAKGGAA
jgi:3-(3-hydroxy-phenyl)propionate hydroxylase